MQKVSAPPAGTHRTVFDRCWTNYADAALPQTITTEEIMLARKAFDGGARALYELLTRMQELADRRGDPPLSLARVARLLGWEDGASIN